MLYTKSVIFSLACLMPSAIWPAFDFDDLSRFTVFVNYLDIIPIRCLLTQSIRGAVLGNKLGHAIVDTINLFSSSKNSAPADATPTHPPNPDGQKGAPDHPDA